MMPAVPVFEQRDISFRILCWRKTINDSSLLNNFSGKRSEAFSHKARQNDFAFFPVCNIPVLFISLNLSFSANIAGIDLIFG